MSLPPAVPTDSTNIPDWVRKAASLLNNLRGRATDGGVTATRPADPTVGQIFFDTTLGHWIGWNGSSWRYVSTGEAAP